MKKDLALIGALLLVVLALVLFGKSYSSIGFTGSSNNSSISSAQAKGSVPVKVKSLEITARIANTDDERRKGLSKIDSLPISQGMLFTFKSESKYGIWMKDMRFPIDIIWIDSQKKIVDIVANAPVEQGKKDSQITKYYPSTNALYILEINAGISALNGLQVGDTVDFSL